MIKTCIFDLDGTLLYTIDNITARVNGTLEKYGFEKISAELCMSIVGKGSRNLIGRVLDLRGVSDETLRETFYQDFLKDYDADPNYLVTPYEGIPELLSELKSRGVRLGVLSNKPHPATLLSIDTFFPNVFESVYGGRDGYPLKPLSDSADVILGELGARADEIAFIGDSEIDVHTAINVGAGLGIAVTWGYRSREQLAAAGATVFADTPTEILKLIN